MRRYLFHHLCSCLPEGCVLPWWAMAVRGLLFPIETLGWLLTRQNHHDILSDTYVIYGLRYYAAIFRCLAKAKQGDIALVRLERVGKEMLVKSIALVPTSH